ncbi:hypothetical protein H17ap60334_00275 [Thermosipho africanus H17ap60334]|jgi:uncharacterized protein|uniref:DUF177 domain-containing protein n=1 Tax=Thermosipho africanus (strain TCF52B) TaxID=484019 RepID=B7IGQ2_THEAB|nr:MULTISPECIES: DUF177 domain-containing protein [Thermosipho]HCF38513.1 DUF177 domain-containing protein [Thermosipho africanus]ACJ75266.1 conserved hypothetical protein [Thermosipho africanus TCF52B]EKF50333.1 hypothetical protein H17ap60334_00275 [Thermosipho africanus H17ap60334]MBZ4651164.1 hypothetical protein [Thermosipho sp. (in: thermotogales)]RDI90654.1 hypothetical protein Ob7_08047 [Thermosipho africanus Ob7]
MKWKIKIKDIIAKKNVKIEDYYESEYIELHTGTYKVIDKRFKVKISIVFTDDTIVVGGYVSGKVERPCDRCLEMTVMPLEGTIEAVYDLKNEPNFKNSEIENLKNVIYYKGEEIDLEERILEALVVSAPDVFVCKEDCKGLCPFCGENLNENPDHVCKEMEVFNIDPRFEKLLKLKEEMQNKN